MGNEFFDALLNFLDNRKDIKYMVWAKTEYKNDWKYAYEHMCLTGKAPTYYKEN